MSLYAGTRDFISLFYLIASISTEHDKDERTLKRELNEENQRLKWQIASYSTLANKGWYLWYQASPISIHISLLKNSS